MKTEEYIAKVREIHGDKYDYSLIKQINWKEKIPIICSKHGVFMQLPSAHLSHQECPKCKGRGLNTSDIIALFNEVHGNKYDYSKVAYHKMHEKVCIICPKHGEFWQTPSKHISKKQGCPKCAKEHLIKTNTSSTEDFINKSIAKHGTLYDYSISKYQGVYEKINIICPKHGLFSQRANDHLNGHGCPKCHESKLEKACKDVLKSEGIEYISQQRFEWLGRQSLDFYLPQYNIGIECQGKQHFSLGGGWEKDGLMRDKMFALQKERDKRKFSLCKEHGIDILYFTNDEKILNEGLSIYSSDNVFFKMEDIIYRIDKKTSD